MPEENRAITEAILRGNWRKLTSDVCASQYPQLIIFMIGGIYSVPNELIQADPMPIWQSGDYLLHDNLRIAIQSSNDAMLSYRITLEDDLLIITDEGNCTVQYERFLTSN